MKKTRRKSAYYDRFVSINQLKFEGFETPFEQDLDANNRWVVLSKLLPWDDICSLYDKHVGRKQFGRQPLPPRVIIGALILKHLNDLSDREVIFQIQENVYFQYFLGFSAMVKEPVFSPSLFVEIRKRLSADFINRLNELIISMSSQFPLNKESSQEDDSQTEKTERGDNPEVKNKGKVLFDATCGPQDISYPTDLDLLNEARKKSEQLIGLLYHRSMHINKPRTDSKEARRFYLQTAQKKRKTRKELRKAIGKQLTYLKNNIQSIHKLLDEYETNPLKKKDMKYLFVIQTVYEQQRQMYEQHTHSIEHRIVSIHQPHVRPIVRGKAQSNVEFGSKLHVSLIDGFCFLDEISWDAFNEGSHMLSYVEQFRKRFGFYPKEILADNIYCTRENRKQVKLYGIHLKAKPLGRPSLSEAVAVHVSPGERNPIEGKFGQAKRAYGLNRIRARLKHTSETWIASIILVLNLVNLAGLALLWHILSMTTCKLSRLRLLVFNMICFNRLINSAQYEKSANPFNIY